MTSQPGAPAGVRMVRTSASRRVLRVTLLAMAGVVLAVLVALLGLRVTGVTVAGRLASRESPAVRPAGSPGERRSFVVPPPALAEGSAPAAPAPEPRPPSARAATRTPAAAPAAEPPEKEDEPFTIGDAKEQTGMKVFPPMGTKPIKRGIVVPDDFALPPGYVRHYQSTDDGERLPAILMFSPDFEWVDAAGAPMALPADRIVPPEMAPPGLAVEMLEPPAAKPPPDGRP